MKEKIIKFIIIGLIIVVAFVLQSSMFFGNNQIIATPNLLIIVVCIFGFMCGRNYGCIIGFICGILVDILFGDVIGLYALIYMYIGFIAGLFRKMFYSDHVFMPMLLVFTNDLIYNLLCYIFRFLLRNKLDFSFYFEKRILPEMIITAFVTFLVYKLFYLLNEKIFLKNQESTLNFDR